MARIEFKANQAGLERLLRDVRGPVVLHVANKGREAEGAYRRCIPIVSGQLKRGVRSQLVRRGRDWGFDVFNDEPYATWIEDGRRYDPRSGRTIYVKVGPRPCLRQALRAVGLSRSTRVA